MIREGISKLFTGSESFPHVPISGNKPLISDRNIRAYSDTEKFVNFFYTGSVFSLTVTFCLSCCYFATCVGGGLSGLHL